MSINKGVAWYDVNGSGPVRDILVLLHLPYTAWHLSYAAIGAALAPVMNWTLLGWTVLAFFLAMGIAGHCFDEVTGRPLRTTLPWEVLVVWALVGVVGAWSIGFWVGLKETIWIAPCMVFGTFIVLAYNLEWGRGFFHRDEFFGIAWGAFPVITAYVAQAHTLSWSAVLLAVLLAAFAYFSSMGQRKLSLQSRFWRRKVSRVAGWYVINGATGGAPYSVIEKKDIINPVDLGLKYFNGAIVAIAITLLIMRLMR